VSINDETGVRVVRIPVEDGDRGRSIPYRGGEYPPRALPDRNAPNRPTKGITQAALDLLTASEDAPGAVPAYPTTPESPKPASKAPHCAWTRGNRVPGDRVRARSRGSPSPTPSGRVYTPLYGPGCCCTNSPIVIFVPFVLQEDGSMELSWFMRLSGRLRKLGMHYELTQSLKSLRLNIET